jgi:hypothetical protein
MRGLSPGVVLLLNLSVGAVLFVVAASDRLGRWLSRRSMALLALVAVPLLTAVVLTLYVFGEDSYRGNNISRWDA